MRAERVSHRGFGFVLQPSFLAFASLIAVMKSGVNHGIEQDGRVAILTVRRV